MNKWIYTTDEIHNLNKANRIYYDKRNNDWFLLVEYEEVYLELCKGNEKKIKRRFKAIKDFLISDDEFMEMKE